jgi:hypothetical protein
LVPLGRQAPFLRTMPYCISLLSYIDSQLGLDVVTFDTVNISPQSTDTDAPGSPDVS